jgi:PAS domain S-box-containing protein
MSNISSYVKRDIYEYLIFGLALFLTYLSSLYSYLLFHSIAELFSIIISGGIFLIGWNTRKYIKSSFFLVLGVSFIFIGAIDLLHTLAYSGMGVFPSPSSNLATQLWIAGRYVKAFSFVLALSLIHKKVNPKFLLVFYVLLDTILIWLIFQGFFPTMYIEGFGLTGFKITSEYVVDIIFGVSLGILIIIRYEFSRKVFIYLVIFLVSTITSELSFTFYVNVFDFINLIGHIFKIIAFYFVYKAIIETGLEDPFQLMFRKLKASEKSLQNQTDYLRLAYSESDQIFNAALPLRIINTKFEIIKVNETFCDLFNIKPEEAVGKKCYEIFPQSYCNTEDCALKRIQILKKAVEYESEFELNNGRKLSLIVNSVPYNDNFGEFKGIIQNYTNISNLKEAELSLKQSEEKYRYLINNSLEGVWVLDTEAKTVLVNPSMASMLGYTIDEMMGKPLFTFMDNKARKSAEIYFKRRMEGIQEDHTFRFQHKDGKDIYTSLRASPIYDENNKFNGAMAFITNVTKQKRAQDNLKEAELRYHTAFEESPDGIAILDSDSLKPFEFNDRLCDLLGYSRFELNNLKVQDFEFTNNPIKMVEHLKKVLEKGIDEFETKFKTKYGSVKEILVTTKPIKLAGKIYYQSIFRDITEEKNALEKIEDMAKFPAEDPNPVMRVSKNYVLLANNASQDIFNVDEGSKIPPILVGRVQKAFSEKKSEEFEISIKNHVYSLFIVPIEGSNYANIYGMDITLRKKAKEDLERFVTTVSHELRTPISVLVLSIEFLNNHTEQLTEELRNQININIEKNVYLLKGLIEDILVLSRIDEQKIKIEWEEYHPSTLIEELLNLMQPMGKAKNFTFQVKVPKNLKLYGDPKRMDQVFRIFIDNAMKYSKDHGNIVIQATDSYIGNYNKEKKEGVLFEIIDEGIGISTEDLPRIFDRFYRSEQVTDIPGTGLGLSIARELVNLHDGDVFVTSELGKGTNFAIFLPHYPKTG